MKTLHLAVVCPTSGLPQNTNQIRRAVWAEVTDLLQPNLGKFYSSFYPASDAWGTELNVPYGVVLGRDDPGRFARIAAAATDAQNAAFNFHRDGLMAEMDPKQLQKAGGVLVFTVHLPDASQDLEAHTIWHIGLASGALLPDCGIYYMEQRCAVITPEMMNTIVGNLANYAVCVVQLEVSV